MAIRPRDARKSIHSAEQTAFCELMVATRKRAGLTQQQVAKTLGRPQSFVAKYETGERRIDVIELLEIAHALKADPVSVLRSLIQRIK
jgi:transcriptional regulator with XRE-family HTH domain